MALTTTGALLSFLGNSACNLSDSDLQTLMNQASAVVKEYIGRDIESATYTEFYDGDGYRDIGLRQRPVTAITSVWIDPEGYYGDGSGSFTTSDLQVAGEDYALVRNNLTLSKTGLLRWGRWPRGTGNIKVTYVGGYTTVPADIQLAVHQVAAWIRKTAEHGGSSLASENLGDYGYALGGPVGTMTGIGVGFPVMVRQILARHREVSI